MPANPIIADLSKPFRVVCDDTIKAVIYAPAHHFIAIDGPGDHGPLEAVGIINEARARGPDIEAFLVHVEGDGGGGEELPRVGCRKANIGDGERGEVMGAEGEVFDLNNN